MTFPPDSRFYTRNFYDSIITPGFTNCRCQIQAALICILSRDQRKRSQQEIYQQISKDVNRITGIRGFPSQPPTIGSRFGGQPVQFVIQAPNFEKLVEVLPKFLEETRKEPALQFVDANLRINRPELSLTIDRQKAADLSVSFNDVATTLQVAFGSQRFGYFIKDGKQYRCWDSSRENRDRPYDLKIYLC
jgi:multidrug efflux pump